MKGTIGKCIEDLVVKKFGQEKWQAALVKAGMPATKHFSPLDDVADAEVMNLMKAIGETCKITMQQTMEAFGEYWSTTYAPSIYKSYFMGAKSTREFLLKLDNIHVAMTQSVKNAHPPRFRYEWKGENHLVLHYQSERGLVALMPGLIAGLGKYFKDKPHARLQGNEVHVTFG